MSITEKINDLKKQFLNFPPGLKITTATITCKVPGIIFNIENIGLYFDDFDDLLTEKKYGNRREKKKNILTESIENKDINNNNNNNDINNQEIINDNKDINNQEIINDNNKKEDINKVIDEKIEIKDITDIIIDENKLKLPKKRGRKSKKMENDTKKIVKEEKKNNFYNQVSFVFNTDNLMKHNFDENYNNINDDNNVNSTKEDSQKNINDENEQNKKKKKSEKPKIMNIKLFINGSIQMTGCKHFDNIIKVLKIVFERIVKKKNVYNNEKKCYEEKCFVNSYDIKEVNDKKNIYIQQNKKIEEKKFLTKIYSELKLGNVHDISLDKVKNFKTGMINTNFKIGFKVNREILSTKLDNVENVTATYDPISHASVDSKLYIPHLDKKISIFIFESGSITIAGAKSYEQIKYAYKFINKFILENYRELYVKSITTEVLISIIKNMK